MWSSRLNAPCSYHNFYFDFNKSEMLAYSFLLAITFLVIYMRSICLAVWFRLELDRVHVGYQSFIPYCVVKFVTCVCRVLYSSSLKVFSRTCIRTISKWLTFAYKIQGNTHATLYPYTLNTDVGKMKWLAGSVIRGDNGKCAWLLSSKLRGLGHM